MSRGRREFTYSTEDSKWGNEEKRKTKTLRPLNDDLFICFIVEEINGEEKLCSRRSEM